MNNISIYFVLFELLVYALFLICLRFAWRGGNAEALGLLAGVLFGVILESATIRQLNAYHYGRFLIMLGDVPLAVGVAWGCIIYSARMFSDASSLPWLARPILDGLLALNIDLSMDAIAIRLGMWDWGLGMQSQYFGVPWVNFWAWFWVVFSFSLGLRMTERFVGKQGRWLAPLGGVLVGLAGVLGTNYLIVFVVPRPYYQATIFAVLGLALFLTAIQRPRFGVRRMEALAAYVPLGFHLYFLAAGLISGVIFQPLYLLLVSGSMLFLALLLHRDQLSWLKRSTMKS